MTEGAYMLLLLCNEFRPMIHGINIKCSSRVLLCMCYAWIFALPIEAILWLFAFMHMMYIWALLGEYRQKKNVLLGC